KGCRRRSSGTGLATRPARHWPLAAEAEVAAVAAEPGTLPQPRSPIRPGRFALPEVEEAAEVEAAVGVDCHRTSLLRQPRKFGHCCTGPSGSWDRRRNSTACGLAGFGRRLSVRNSW